MRIEDAVTAKKIAEQLLHVSVVLQYWDNSTETHKNEFAEYLLETYKKEINSRI